MTVINKITGGELGLCVVKSKYIPPFSDWVSGENIFDLQQLPPLEEIMKWRNCLSIYVAFEV